MNEAAPITQLLFTVQFQAPVTALTVFDYADLRGVFGDFPVHKQVSRAGPMPVMQPNVTVATIETDAPRIQLNTEDLQWVILFQFDRLSVGWNRISSLEEDAGYPGFNAVARRLYLIQDRLFAYLAEKTLAIPSVGVGEIAYSDTFRLKKPDGSLHSIEDFFTNVRSLPEFRFNLVNLTYTRLVEGEYPSHVETHIQGPGTNPSGESVVLLRTTVRFMAEGNDALHDRFDHAHREAQSVFEMLVKPDAFAI